MGVVGEARKDPFFGSPPSAWPTRASPPQPKGLPLTPIAVPCSGGCGRERSPGDGSRLRQGMQNKSLPDGTGATFRSSRGSRLSAASSSSSSPLLQASPLSRPGQAPFPGKQLEIPPPQTLWSCGHASRAVTFVLLGLALKCFGDLQGTCQLQDSVPILASGCLGTSRGGAAPPAVP